MEVPIFFVQCIGIISGFHRCHLGGNLLRPRLAGGHLRPQCRTLCGVTAGIKESLRSVKRIILRLERSVELLNPAFGVVIQAGQFLTLGVGGIDSLLRSFLRTRQSRRQIGDGHIISLEIVELLLKLFGVISGIGSNFAVCRQVFLDLLLQLLEFLGVFHIVRGLLQKVGQFILQRLFLGLSLSFKLLFELIDIGFCAVC